MKTSQPSFRFHEQVRKLFAHPLFQFEARRYPTGPGCYLMKDTQGEVIYVGKAVNLRERLASYFHHRHRDAHVQRLTARIAGVEVILVTTEQESLVLENNLIKRYKPRFNRRLVDENSGYCYIILTAEEFPRLLPYHKGYNNSGWKMVKEGNARARFGPYINGRFRDILLEYIIDTCKLRTCEHLPERACLRAHIERCSGACEGRISAEEYNRAVERAAAFLSRQTQEPAERLIAELKQHMQERAERLQFELARRIRDRVAALESTLEKQAVERDAPYDQEVLYFGEGHVLVLEVLRGALQGARLFELQARRERSERGAAQRGFLQGRYGGGCATELLVNRLDGPELPAWAHAHGLKLYLPRNEPERGLMELCELNYEYRVSVLEASEGQTLPDLPLPSGKAEKDPGFKIRKSTH